MYNVAASLVNSGKGKAPILTLSATKKVITPDKQGTALAEQMTTTNYWGQGAYRDELNFYQSDSCSFLKVIK